MIWATKRVSGDELKSIELLFREQAEAFDEHKQMLLVKVDEAWPMMVVFVWVHNEELLSSYCGFDLCTRRNLPSAPTLVSGCPIRFCRTFGSA